MKQKVFYVVFVLVTILLLIFINRKTNVNQAVQAQKAVEQFSAEQRDVLVKHLQTSFPFESKSAITLINKTKPVQSPSFLENKNIATTVQSKKVSTSSASLAAGSGAKGSQAVLEKPEAGVTKIGKRPPVERVKELNSQGIILQ